MQTETTESVEDQFEIRRVVVIGAGTMGHGIAHVCAAAGCEVWLNDVSTAAIDAGLAKIAQNLAIGVQKGKLTQAAADATRARLHGEPDLRIAASLADLVIEAAPESIELKRQIFQTLTETLPAGALIASNTSSIPLRLLTDGLPRPDRFLGLHFFNPVHIQPLLEVVRAATTSDAALASALEFAKQIGKEPIVVRDVAGFASSRLGLALGLEAIRMLQEGVASAADIDKAMELGYRHPMGPLKLTDLVGLDVRLAIAETLAREIDPVRFAPPQLLREMVAAGKLGKKSGEGFYLYEK
jgi:3-hydroxybutyryl-CoA dehydrogenase